LTHTPKILGLDRRKMSKSYDNAIFLSDGPDQVRAKVMQMITDPQRARRSDPGNPDICNVFEFHKLYTDSQVTQQIGTQCRAAQIGCVECKKSMAENLVTGMAPMLETRRHYEANPGLVQEIMEAGSRKAREVARQTMQQVRAAINIF
jgi:tryptophanyl-tRNA synthetase